jgi:membrane associated rhomboid family serine protease
MKPRQSLLSLILVLTVSLVAGRTALPLAASGAHYVFPLSSRFDRKWGCLRGYQQGKRLRGGGVNVEDDFLFSATRRLKSTARFYSVQRQLRPNERGSVWTGRIILLNVAAFALQALYPSFTRWGIKLSDKILNGQDLYRLLSPVILHGGIAHLLMNTFSLQQVGPEVERYFGPGRFLAVYAASGIAGNYMSAIMSPNPSLGASGAIFGIVGAYFTFLVQNEDLFGWQGEFLQQNLARTIGMNLIFGAVSPSIDNWGHAGGFLGGITMAVLFGPRLSFVALPEGGSVLVDEPRLRLPPYIESIPDKIGKRFTKMKRRMQINHYMGDLPEKPWRMKRPQQYRRQMAPNRSIRPRFVK